MGPEIAFLTGLKGQCCWSGPRIEEQASGAAWHFQESRLPEAAQLMEDRPHHEPYLNVTSGIPPSLSRSSFLAVAPEHLSVLLVPPDPCQVS